MNVPEQAVAIAAAYGFGGPAIPYHWEHFATFAEEEGISLDHFDDYEYPWRLWMSGACAESSRG